MKKLLAIVVLTLMYSFSYSWGKPSLSQVEKVVKYICGVTTMEILNVNLI